MQATVLSPNADLGGHFTDFGAAAANRARRAKRFGFLWRAPEGAVFSTDACPDAEQLEKVKLPVDVPREEGRRSFYLRFAAPKPRKGFDASLRIDATLFAAEIRIGGAYAASLHSCLFGAEIRLPPLAGECFLELRLLENAGGSADVLRGIALGTLPKTRFADAWFQTRLDGEDALLSGDFIVTAGDEEAARGERIRLTVLDGRNQELAAGEADVPAFRRRYWAAVRIEIFLSAPRLWNPGDPYRHVLILELLRADGTVADVRRVRFGLRELLLTRYDRETGAGPRFLLNRQPLKLFGAAVRAPSPALLKQAVSSGCGALRVIDPCDRAFLDAAEEQGILLFCEPSFAVRPEEKRKRTGPDPMERPAALVGEMVARLKNRASVVCWSLGSRGAFGAGALKELIRSLDGSRAVCCEGDVRFAASDFFAAADCAPGALSDVAGRKTITGGGRVPFGRYQHKPFLLTDASPDRESIREKCAVIRAHDRLLGLFADMTGESDLSLLSGAFDETAAEEKTGEE